MSDKKVKIILVDHTHWDREWYYTFDKYRYRLVRGIDMALDIFKRKPDYHSFMLDGQVAPLEDYLEIRPERKAEIEKRIKEGKLVIGPWFIQPDEFLVDEESIVRNLMLGIRLAQKYGKCMMIGYLPDTFGHTAQLPQILKGFDINVFFFHRGLGPEFEEIGTPFKWRAPDGSTVIAYFLYGGYCNLMHVKPGPCKTLDLMKELYERWKKYLRVSAIPGMTGCDHHLPKEFIPDVVKALREKPDIPFEVKQGSLEEVAKIAEEESDKLKVHEGELLSSHYHWVLYGTWSARVYLKQLCFENEVKLVYLVEPLWTLAWLHGAKYPAEFIWKAWRYVLLSQPHDSICGCSTDEVHKECESRFIKAKTLAEELLECTARRFNVLYYYVTLAGYDYKMHALSYLNSKIDMTFGDADFYVTAFNTIPWERKAVVKLRVRPGEVGKDFIEAFLRIMPSGYEILRERVEKKGSLKVDFDKIALKDPTGKLVPCQIRKYPDNSIEILWVDELPACGYKTYAIVSSEQPKTELKYGENYIENEFFKVEFDLEHGGALRVTDKRTGLVYEGLNILEDDGDKGDEYDYSPPEDNEVVRSDSCKASLRIVEKGPVAVTAEVAYTLKLPKSLTPDRKKRSEEKVDVPVKIFVTLYAGIPRIDVKTVVFNVAKDHRLRAVFPVGVKTSEHYAKTHYYVIKRSNKTPYYYIRRDGSRAPVTTYPTRLWVDVSDGKKGLCVATRGLYEYEVREGEKGTEIVFTLMRCIGWLSKGDLLTRPGHAGPEIATPDAQCIGERVFEYTIIPHSGTWLEADVLKIAHEYMVPAIAHEDLAHKGELPPVQTFVKLSGKNVIMSTFKKCEDDDTVILRLYNPTPEEATAEVEFYKTIEKAWLTNLNEEPKGEIPVSGKKITLKLSPYKITTVKVKLA